MLQIQSLDVVYVDVMFGLSCPTAELNQFDFHPSQPAHANNYDPGGDVAYRHHD